jgi:hypothetical protein
MSDTAQSAAVQAVLSAEFAAVFGYGVVGAHLAGAARSQASRAMAWHQLQQSGLSLTLSAAGETVPLPEPAYTLPFAVTSARSAVRLAARLEDDVAATYANLVAATAGDERMGAALALGACAVRATQWSGASIPFPGLPERANG